MSCSGARETTARWPLLADRFLPVEGASDRWLDLASGDIVWARVEPDCPPDPVWLAQRAALFGLRHPHIVELLDYGPLGMSSRFEVFRTPGTPRRWTAGASAADEALRSATRYLEARGFSMGRVRRSRMVGVRGRPMLLPEAGTGCVVACQGTTGRLRRQARDASLPEGIARIIEFLESARRSDPRWLQLQVSKDSGVFPALTLLARELRLRGFVPVNAAVVERASPVRGRRWCGGALVGRSVVLLSGLHPGDQAGRRQALTAAAAVLELAVTQVSAVPAVVSVGRRSDAAPWVAMDGLPRMRKRAPTGAPVLRERAPRYSADAGPVAVRPSPDGDVEGWRRLGQGRALVERGRHQAAARAIREAVGMFVRRRDWLNAGTAWCELGCLWQRRGALTDAGRAFEEAGRQFRGAGAVRRAIAAAALEAEVRLETGQIPLAERLLRVADLAAAQLEATRERIVIRSLLLRCLLWQGRTEEAARLASWPVPGSVESAVQQPNKKPPMSVERAAERAAAFQSDTTPLVSWHVAAAAVALHRRSLEQASVHLASALRLTRDAPAAACGAEVVAVRFHGMVGDADAVRLHATRGLGAARAAAAPREALRLRVGLLDALAQVGMSEEARALAARLLRYRRPVVTVLDAELGTALGRVLPDNAEAVRHAACAAAFARDRGLAGVIDPDAAPGRLSAPACDIVDLLEQTHEADDDSELLTGVAGLLRSRLGALSVTIASVEDPDTAIVIAGTGRGTISARATAAGIVVGPVRTAAGIEVSAPVRCGGECVGSVSARWAADGPGRADEARALIAAAAAMAGPFLRAIIDARQRTADSPGDGELIGVGRDMADLRLAVARAAAAPFPVLITGESGVGKEVVARAIHRSGPRRLRPFVPLNCAALTDELIETELFGHARGAFTGAVAERRGVFEEADGGTVFLDEVSELSPRAQAKLLRVLQEREIRRVGESFARPVDMRILAASNQSLEHLVGGRTFRPDLRYRLDVIHIHVPALRQRAEDIPALAAEFWQQSSRLVGCRARLGSKLLSALARYEWPGNVRELQNTMASLAVAAPRRGVVGLAQLPASVARTVSMPAGSRLEEARRVFDRRLITGALARAGQRTGPAARELGISRQGLLKMMKRLGVAGGSRGSGSGR